MERSGINAYMKICVVHRVCPSLSKSAVGFSSKQEMVRATAASLVTALAKLGTKVRLAVILDGCDDAYVTIFESAVELSGKGLVELLVERTDAIGNAATWNRQVELAMECGADAEYILFSEDDYLFREDALVAMLDFMEQGVADFVSPLDHPDLYLPENRREKANIVVSRHGHWRTVENTCMTFMMRRSLLPKILRPCHVYQFNCSDRAFWQVLTQWRMRRPLTWVIAALAFFRWMINHKYCSHYLTFVHIIRRLGVRALFFPKYTLWCPLPTLAVHLSSLSLSLSAESFFERNCRNIRMTAHNYLGLGCD